MHSYPFVGLASAFHGRQHDHARVRTSMCCIVCRACFPKRARVEHATCAEAVSANLSCVSV
eukprot:5592395-Prymnesium_polylepis.1